MARLDGTNLNKLENLIDPQVLGEFIDWNMMDAIKFAPLCSVNNDLQGRPGSTLTLPMYVIDPENFYAVDVAEGEDIPMNNLATDTVEVSIKKAGKGIKLTDEAILSAYGNPVDEVAKQLLMAIAGKVDNDCIDVFRGVDKDGKSVDDKEGKITPKRQEKPINRAFDKYVISDMMEVFGENLEEEMTVLINPKHLAALRKDEDFVQIMAGQAVISGEIGQLFGCRVVVSNKVNEDEAFLVKQGAVEILMKRNVAVEADRDIINKTNVYVVDEHYTVYLKNPARLVRATGITKAE